MAVFLSYRSINSNLFTICIECFSASSIHIRASDSASQLSLEKESVASFPSAASTPELHAVDSSDVKVRILNKHYYCFNMS